MKAASLPIVVSFVGVLLCAPISAQVTQRVSVSSAGEQGNAMSRFGRISADGRYVGFSSTATNLVPGDANGTWDVFVRDRSSGTTELVSVSSGGAQGSRESYFSGISADGRYVVFSSPSTSLVPEGGDYFPDVFVRDRLAGTTERVSVDSNGIEGNDSSSGGQITPDGRFVAFLSWADNLAPNTDSYGHIYVRDRLRGTTELVSRNFNGIQGNDYCPEPPSISDDGHVVAFSSYATNLVAGDTNGVIDAFVRDRRIGSIERISVSPSGMQGGRPSHLPWVSGNGRYVTFTSAAASLVPGVSNGYYDILVRDRQENTIERVSVDSNGVEGNDNSVASTISADGRYVAFKSYATNLVGGEHDGNNVFLRDRVAGITESVVIPFGEGSAMGIHSDPSISSDGRYVVFSSTAHDLVPGDTNGVYDLFVRDRIGGTSFTALCAPGVGGVIGCPCVNPPSGFGRGCDNSSGTGGAMLAASGGTFLSSDSLMLVTRGEPSTALSVVMQGDSAISGGLAYGQGVRCVDGSLRRLFVKQAAGGSLTAPDFEAGEATISALSAAKGDVIQAGESRRYLVAYRDPVVIGGCPASSTFNTTQTGEVVWSP